MKKILLFLIVFAGTTVMANTPAPEYNDVNNSCRERGVTVSTTSSSVNVDVPKQLSSGLAATDEYNVNVRVTTNEGSYNYDSRTTGLGSKDSSTSTNHYETYQSSRSNNEEVKKVDVMCYDR